ncbi:hypothetical protein O7634_09270 [Micromonospora sp. WMMD1120]|uniref:hypothetical protein n=1 Tax=Micromonospora sp. WMMD1120 TaxID=3016106 RepID=UPI002416F762|nr:hypothetical protein [Micromonospora sp. WMMD1120]MDG4806940.1 hypothetical protein [Micromonospora sp. WMMD1120]
MVEDSTPVTVHVYCRVEVTITEAAAVIDHAVADLRAADIDWSTEEDDLDAAADELRADVTTALESVVDISRVVESIPGVEFRGGHCWAEHGPARDPYRGPGSVTPTARMVVADRGRRDGTP